MTDRLMTGHILPLLANVDVPKPPDEELESAMREVLDDPETHPKTKARIQRALTVFAKARR